MLLREAFFYTLGRFQGSIGDEWDRCVSEDYVKGMEEAGKLADMHDAVEPRLEPGVDLLQEEIDRGIAEERDADAAASDGSKN